MEFYFEKLYGDLTRLGHFAERDFGWRTTQPTIPPELFKDYPLAEADILIIGDSFSAGRVWQTRLIAKDLKVGTIHWEALKASTLWQESLPNNLGVALRAAGFKGHYIIIESIERLFQMRMQSISQESPLIVKPNIVIKAAPYAKRDRVSLSKPNGADWQQKALFNKIKLLLNLPEKYLKSDMVQARVFDGCLLFSNRLCNYALFINQDFDKETFNSIDNVLTINKNLQSSGIQPIWMIVPDKATIYLGYGKSTKHPYQNIWQNLAQYPELIAPDLGTAFIEKSSQIKDFYMPNDTHLSTDGFLYLGEFMVNGLRKLQANQTNPFSQ